MGPHVSKEEEERLAERTPSEVRREEEELERRKERIR